ncbi:MAG: hypothetical protein HYZ92_07215 [Candidatus Omnitrophica bacterium]|nr:hypothetical protein [Candidatus Omnitrophota bacterium]
MRRPLVLIVGAAAVSVVLTLALQAQEKQATPPASASHPAHPAASASPPAGTVVYTFSDEAQMREFAQAWTKRQASLTRMAVLQGYLTQEQASLGQLNEEMLSKYHLDVKKNYSLDTERKVLLEREEPAQPPTGDAAKSQPPANAPPAPAGKAKP